MGNLSGVREERKRRDRIGRGKRKRWKSYHMTRWLWPPGLELLGEVGHEVLEVLILKPRRLSDLTLLLLPLAKGLLFQNRFNFPFRGIINDIRWWFKNIWSVFFSFFIWS